jgi:hypothetical protein
MRSKLRLAAQMALELGTGSLLQQKVQFQDPIIGIFGAHTAKSGGTDVL